MKYLQSNRAFFEDLPNNKVYGGTHGKIPANEVRRIFQKKTFHETGGYGSNDLLKSSQFGDEIQIFIPQLLLVLQEKNILFLVGDISKDSKD